MLCTCGACGAQAIRHWAASAVSHCIDGAPDVTKAGWQRRPSQPLDCSRHMPRSCKESRSAREHDWHSLVTPGLQKQQQHSSTMQERTAISCAAQPDDNQVAPSSRQRICDPHLISYDTFIENQTGGVAEENMAEGYGCSNSMPQHTREVLQIDSMLCCWQIHQGCSLSLPHAWGL